ncbi:potassium channel family protein [Thomasclavelia saccharogumia]|uniref:potassium channel family protein n=1 Tax=Thomasclavelia saccharogumia TaxID=341225 RepID=UPI00047E725F|nr:NAD-binding protein [Thomasclavelia saccharogumia]
MKKKVLLVGGFHKAISLTQLLLKKGYDVTVINNQYDNCRILAENENIEVIYGDGTKPFVLEEAETATMNIVVALTPKDADNLVICELAKKKFHVKKTVSLVADPLKTKFFYQMGIDSVVCAISVVTGIIEQQAFVDKISKVIAVEEGKVNLIELRITPNMSVCHQKIKEINIPQNTIIAYILRDENGIVPHGNTIILPNDKLIMICETITQDKVIRELTGNETYFKK